MKQISNNIIKPEKKSLRIVALGVIGPVGETRHVGHWGV